MGQHGSGWHSAEAQISTAYRAFSKEKINAELGINIGLNSVNVTLQALPVHNNSASIDYNERFNWIGADQMKKEYHKALVKVYCFLHNQFTVGYLKQSINSKRNNIVSKGQRNDLRDFFELSTLSIISNIRCRRITFVAFVLDFGLKLVFKVLELYFRCYLDICKI